MTLTTVTQPERRRAAAIIRNAVVDAALSMKRLARAMQRCSELQQLRDRPDYLLADIGLTRKDVDAALAEPFWREATLHLERSARSGSALVIALVATMAGTNPAAAEEIRLLSAAAMQSVFREIAGEFERGSGHKLIISYGTIGGVAQRVQAGEGADFVIGSSLTMPGLAKDGRINPASLVTICRTGIGIVAPTTDRARRIASVDDFKQAALDAKVVIYADPVRGGAAGVHVARVLQKLGIADRLKSQITLAAGGDVTEVTLAQGGGALGITQISEIVGKAGADYLGPMPGELQNYTVFVGGTPAGAGPSNGATAFIKFLQGPAALAAIEAKGMQVD
jgi:molybdate transport system substrate-binding protein